MLQLRDLTRVNFVITYIQRNNMFTESTRDFKLNIESDVCLPDIQDKSQSSQIIEDDKEKEKKIIKVKKRFGIYLIF